MLTNGVVYEDTFKLCSFWWRCQSYESSTGPPTILGAVVPIGISHLPFDSRWVTNLHSGSHQTSQPSPPSKQPKTQFCSFACPSACDAESTGCASCNLSSLQLWTNKEIVWHEWGNLAMEIIFGDTECPGAGGKDLCPFRWSFRLVRNSQLLLHTH